MRNYKILTRKKLFEIFDTLFTTYGPRHWWPADSPFEVVIGAILTQNTSWKNVTRAIDKLKENKILNPKSLSEIPAGELAQSIISSGYYNQKAKKIKTFVNYFQKFGFQLEKMKEVPTERLREELLGLNGIGPETADSILLYALNKPAFVIDAYTKRLFSRLGFVPETIKYHELQQVFIKNLPQEVSLFNEYHALIDYFAHHQCKKQPLCDTCFLKKQCIYWKSAEPAIANGGVDRTSRKMRSR